MKKWLLVFCCVFLWCCTTACSEEAETHPPVYLHQIDLGCAAGYLLTCGDTVILVDCGIDTDNFIHDTRAFEYLAASGIDHVDAYFVTHYHNDHALNVTELMALYGNEDTIIYGPSDTLPERFDPGAAQYQPLRIGDTVDVDDFSVKCIGPMAVTAGGEVNSDSLNFVIRYQERKFLFTGDFMHYKIRELYMEEISDVDVLCFPHHGLQPFCMSEAEAKTANPKVVLVPGKSAGMVRVWLSNRGIHAPVYSSNCGNVVVSIQGDDLEIFDQVLPGQFAYGVEGDPS